jgi:hypothetical protein
VCARPASRADAAALAAGAHPAHACHASQPPPSREARAGAARLRLRRRAALLRDWTPFGSFHAWIGLLAAGLFAATALAGHRIETGQSRAFDAHALLGGVAVLAAAVAAVAGFVLLP